MCDVDDIMIELTMLNRALYDERTANGARHVTVISDALALELVARLEELIELHDRMADIHAYLVEIGAVVPSDPEPDIMKLPTTKGRTMSYGREIRPCGCECCRPGGWCGGCGHAGCGGRARNM